MSIVHLALIFLLAVAASELLVRLFPLPIPLPWLQIGIGVLLSTLFNFEVVLEPHVFLLLFIPPLLFLDGWRIPKGALRIDLRSILTLAIGLVIFTVLGLGFFLHWLIPAMPLAVAFALAAIVSPTDPVAVSAMTANAPLPSRLSHILEGESLLNDATGLVCFSFAIAATMTGSFSFINASVSFFIVSGGGILVGIGVPFFIGKFNRVLIARAGEDPASQILISILMPFAAYLLAEHFQLSGILAAAVAGIASHYEELSGRSLAATRVQRTAIWDMLQTCLNGMIFILLGEQLPRLLSRLPQVAASIDIHSTWELIGYSLLITIALGVLRFVWVWGVMSKLIFGANKQGAKRSADQTRVLAITTTAGVRGAITLAGILTLPLLMPDGTDFPARDAAIFFAVMVILISFLIASIGLPFLTRGKLPELPTKHARASESIARRKASEAAIAVLEDKLKNLPNDIKETEMRAEAASFLLSAYRRKLDSGDTNNLNGQAMSIKRENEKRLHLLALKAEREALLIMRKEHQIDDDLHRYLLREIDLIESSLYSH